MGIFGKKKSENWKSIDPPSNNPSPIIMYPTNHVDNISLNNGSDGDMNIHDQNQTDKDSAVNDTKIDIDQEVSNEVSIERIKPASVKPIVVAPESKNNESQAAHIDLTQLAPIPEAKIDVPVLTYSDNIQYASAVSHMAIVEGNISVPGNIFIGGQVNGHVTSSDVIVVDEGKIVGDVKCRQLVLRSTSSIEGNVICDSFTMDKECCVKGDIYAAGVVAADGTVSGKSIKAGTIRLLKNANISAEIVADRMSVASGAKLNAFVKMAKNA